MDKFVVTGGRRLAGRVRIGGAKNAALPAMAATLLTAESVTLEDVPRLEDVKVFTAVLTELGAEVAEPAPGVLSVRCRAVKNTQTSYELVRRMRASVLAMGPLLARYGRARVPLPGGCAIGSRPIDLHLKGFAALGCSINLGHGVVEAVAPSEGLKGGGEVYLDFPSVGATENLIMAASLARGLTIIENAAEEPEVQDLAVLLNRMGARVEGAGTRIITVRGVSELGGVRHRVIPDRIEAGTFMVAAAMTEGLIGLENVVPWQLEPATAKLREMGVGVYEDGDVLFVEGPGPGHRPKATDIKTLPYPGFPTDLQPQFMALLAVSEGVGFVTETVFENRFMHVAELRRMGANVRIEGRTAIIQGSVHLAGAPAAATDLRAGAALVLAGLAAEGVTEVSHIYHIDRGYDSFETKLRGLGAQLYRLQT